MGDLCEGISLSNSRSVSFQISAVGGSGNGHNRRATRDRCAAALSPVDDYSRRGHNAHLHNASRVT